MPRIRGRARRRSGRVRGVRARFAGPKALGLCALMPSTYKRHVSRQTKPTENDNVMQARRALQLDVGRRVRSIRMGMDMGQAECARAAGMDKSSMWRLEKGEQNVTLDLLARISLALGVGMDELVVGVHPDPALVDQSPQD